MMHHFVTRITNDGHRSTVTVDVGDTERTYDISGSKTDEEACQAAAEMAIGDFPVFSTDRTIVGIKEKMIANEEKFAEEVLMAHYGDLSLPIGVIACALDYEWDIAPHSDEIASLVFRKRTVG